MEWGLPVGLPLHVPSRVLEPQLGILQGESLPLPLQIFTFLTANCILTNVAAHKLNIPNWVFPGWMVCLGNSDIPGLELGEILTNPQKILCPKMAKWADQIPAVFCGRDAGGVLRICLKHLCFKKYLAFTVVQHGS